MKLLKILLGGTLTMSLAPTLIAQCTVSITPSVVTINCGETATFEALGVPSTPALSTNFDGAAIGPGWSTTATMIYTNPCGPSLDGTPSAWFGNVPLPRTLTTNAFDLTCGAEICFDLDFAGDDPCGGCSHCEDPDLTNEGVYFSYSVNGGATWVDMYYFQSNSANNTPHYDWDNYCFTLPPAAWSANTLFRWNQPSASSSVNDHWGIDNVTITPFYCNPSYDWAHIPGFPDNELQVVNPTDTTTYYVTFSDGIVVCTDSVVVNVVPLQIDIVGTPNPVDCGSCSDLSVNFLNGTAGPTVSYTWTTGQVDDPNSPNPTACPTSLTGELFTVMVANSANGCFAEDTSTLFVDCECEILTFDGAAICQPGGVFDVTGTFEYSHSPTTGTIEVEATNGTGTYSQTFNLPFSDSTLFNYAITGIPNDGTSTTMIIYFSDSLSCTQTFNVSPPVLPTVASVSGGATYCLGDAIAPVTASPTGTGPWTVSYTLNGTPLTATSPTSPVTLGSTPGVYVVTGIVDQICSNSSSGTQTITVNELPTVSAGDDQAHCDGTITQVSGSGAVSYTWTNGVTNETSFTPPVGNTTYTVTGTDVNGCTNTDEMNIVVTAYPPPPSVGPQDEQYCKQSTEIPPFLATGIGQTFTWYSDGAQVNQLGVGSSFQPLIIEGTTTYYVTQSLNGCEGAPASIGIFLENCEATIVMPNVFTPNTDGTNSLFHPVFMDGVTEAQTIVVNRWGNVIFETDDQQINWNGYDKSGKEVEEGTYFWKMTYRDLNFDEFVIHGNVQVIR